MRLLDSSRQVDSPRQGVLENEASLCRDSPCVGGFETRPYENHYGVCHILGAPRSQGRQDFLKTIIAIIAG
ncbi:MAG: hypothetical protein NTV33_12580 [Coprothermobacterota bacterium]|nr:hypothetical protein [Coprothermobacterota bacterium]